MTALHGFVRRLGSATTSLTLGLIGALALAGTVLAQVPSTNDTSDGNLNTGMGSGALGGPASSNGGIGNTASGAHALQLNTSGQHNTGSGAYALTNNTTGYFNTASGAWALYYNTTGGDNTASGVQALYYNTTGNENTASGAYALYFNTTGYYNTASGAFALQSNTTGYYNTASGDAALLFNTTGNYNTAAGADALQSNTTGSSNVATGYAALFNNTTGYDNTASGTYALTHNTTGNYNNAYGVHALGTNTTGSGNIAVGVQALFNNTTGWDNTAAGVNALEVNTTGSGNVATGYAALFNTTGSNNIAVGNRAGSYVTTGSNNIEIGNVGTAGDDGLIRMGTQGAQNATYIAGISGSLVTGAAVYVTSTGQLGVLASSERYKTAVASMGARTEKLSQLRPVSFHLKTDPKGDVQYGLIAEEVAKVYPELVIRDSAGRIEGVRYEELAPMLLNEVQQQAAQLSDMRRELVDLKAALHELQTKGVPH